MPDQTETVKIIIEAENQASRALSAVAGDMADLAKPAKGLSSVLGGVGSAFATAVGTLTGGAALKGFDALSSALVGGVSDAREAAKVFAQTQAVIASTGGAAGFTAEQIADMAGSLSAASGKSLFGDDDIQRGQNMLLTFTNITDLLPDTTQTMVDMAQALGTDAGGAAVQLGKALNDPIAGISALSRVGVSFTDQQKEQIKAMQEAGNMAGAQTVILNELNKEFGGSAQAAADADGGMAQLQDTMGELAESIGTALLPLITQFVGWLTSPDIQAGITTLAVGLVDAITAVTAGFGTLLTKLKPVTDFVKDNLTAVMAGLATMLLLVVVPAFVAWATAAGAAAIATIAALAPVLLPIAAIGLAVGLLTTAWEKDWGGMRTTLTSWWHGTVEPMFKAINTWMRDTFTATITALHKAWDKAWGLMSGAITTAKGIIKGVIDTMMGLIDGAIRALNTLIGLINRIPGLPNIPGIGGGGAAGAAPSAAASLATQGMTAGFTPMRPSFAPRGLAFNGDINVTVEMGGLDTRGTPPEQLRHAAYAGTHEAITALVGNLRTQVAQAGTQGPRR